MSNKIISTVNIDDSAKEDESDHDDIENDDEELLNMTGFTNTVEEDKRVPKKGEKYYDYWQKLKSKNHTSVLLYNKYELDKNPILKKDYKKIYVYDKEYTDYIKSRQICTKCTVDKNLNEDFRKDIRYDSGSRYTCKTCHSQQMHEYYSTFDGCVKALLSNCKINAKTRGKRGRIGASEFTLTEKDIKEMFKKQQGLCHYFKSKLKFTRCGDKVSLERLDNDKGYTADNCVLACKMANGFVQMTLEKIQYIMDFVEPTEEEIINNLKKYDITKPPRKKYVKIEEKINVEGIKTYNCTYCGERKTIDQFGKDINKGCHDCIHNEYIKPYNTIVRFCKTAKCHSKVRAAKGRPNMVCEITLDDLKDLFEKQRGRCAISGIFLRFDGKKWVLSLDRKDPSKGYTKDNIQLICGEFNTSDYSAVYIKREGESDVFDCAWTPKNFLIKKKGLIEYYNKKNIVADVEEKIIPVVVKLNGNRKGKKWTEDENDRLEGLYKKDVSRKDIAEMMGRTEDSIKTQISKLNL